MSSGLKMGLNLVKASVRTCRVSGREGEDLLSPRHPGQAWEVRPLLLSPAPPGPEGLRLSCVSPRPLGPRAQSRSLHPPPPRMLPRFRSNSVTRAIWWTWYFASRAPCPGAVNTGEGCMEKALTASSEFLSVDFRKCVCKKQSFIFWT